MRSIQASLSIFILCVVTHAAVAQTNDADTEDFRPLFNGKDLEGWTRVNTAESTWSVRDGMLICTGKPIGELRTTRMYQNFIMEVEWRHMKPRGNAGIFVWADDITARGVPFHRSIEVQVLENAYGNTRSHTTHGDIFPIHGATMTPINGRGGSRAFPTENRSKPSPQWNHYRIECRDGEIALAVNGKVVTRGKDCVPRKGYICIESEGGIVHYRNMKIKDLPETPIKDEHIAIPDRGYRCLYNGIDLDDWKVDGDGWKPNDWVLQHRGEQSSQINTTERLRPAGVIVDTKLQDKNASAEIAIGGVTVAMDYGDTILADELAKPGQWNRLELRLHDKAVSVIINDKHFVELLREKAQSSDTPLHIEATGNADFANIYIRTNATPE